MSFIPSFLFMVKHLEITKIEQFFLVGPCITAGSENFEGEKLAQILKAKLDRLGLSYKIKCVAMYLYDSYKILEENINKNDIVFIFNRQLYENEFDLTPYYDSTLAVRKN